MVVRRVWDGEGEPGDVSEPPPVLILDFPGGTAHHFSPSVPPFAVYSVRQWGALCCSGVLEKFTAR